MHFLEDQRYDCVQCGKSCGTAWRVSVDPETRRNLRGSTLDLRVDQDWEDYVPKRVDGSCAFLQSDRLCAIHAERGEAAKPVVCRMYPFEPVPTPEGIFVSVSFRCTAVQRNVGRPLAEHAFNVAALLEKVALQPVGFAPSPVLDGINIDWDGYKRLEGFLVEQLGLVDPERALGQAIWALSEEVARGAELVDVERSLASRRPGRLEEDPVVAAQVAFVQLAALAFIEGLDRRALLEAALAGQPFELPSAGWKGTLTELALAAHGLGARFDGEIARYLKALLFGKQLLMFFHGPLLANLATFYLLPGIVRLYTAAFDGDVFRALDLAESTLGTHARSVPDFIEPFARGFVQQVAAMTD